MVPRFRVDFPVYIFLALGLLILPISWLMGAILAAGFHELCHFLVAKGLGYSCLEFHIGAGGMVMHVQHMTPREELLISASGPLGSFALVLLIRLYPQLAMCALVQGLFNLLPIYPLDGGRILACLFPEREAVCKRIEVCTILGILIAGFILSLRPAFGIYPVFLAILVTGKAIIRKFPCKAAKLGVQ